MKGHVYPRGETWTYVIDLSPDPVSGKRRQKSKGGFRLEKEAWSACRKEIQRIEEGYVVDNENMLYSEFLEIWLEEFAHTKLKVTVYDINKLVIEKRIIPEIGNVKMKDLTPLRIQRFYNKLLKEYSPDYVKSIHSIVSKTLRQAFKWDMLPVNIVDKVDPPRVPKKEMKIWTIDQCLQFLGATKDHPMHIVFSLAIYTGMRRGEILGLRWSDVNFEDKTISIQQTVAWTSSQGIVFQETKTSNSNRSISIPEVLLNDLKVRKITVSKDQMQEKKNYAKHNLICCHKDGRPIKPRWLLEQYEVLIKKSGLPKIRFHDLRHSHATMLISLKIHPKVGAERLGQTASMFTDRYAHVIESMQKEVATTIDTALNSPRSPVDK